MTTDGPTPDVHDLEPGDFRRQVHSFEHWMGAVEGYLTGLEHGHLPQLRGGPDTDADRDRLITILCSYAVAENAALEASSGLLRIAPNAESKLFLATQVMDEGRHVEVMLQRMEELGVADPLAEVERRASPSIRRFSERLLELVDARDWDCAIFAQNVVLEAMEFSVFRAHAERTDPVTADMLDRVLKDERRHIGFGENELGRRLNADPARRASIRSIKQELDGLVLDTFETVLGELDVPRGDRPELGRDYLQAVDRLQL